MSATKRKRPRDPNQLAKLVVDMATGDAPKDQPPSPAVERAQKAGKAGGPARARKLSATRRRQIAQAAAKKRWQK